MEVMGEIPLACKENWLIENKEPKKPQMLIARAIVTFQNGLVPLRVLNHESQPFTVYKGTKIAKAEVIDPTREISTVGEETNTRCSEKEWEEVLSNVMQHMPANLNENQLQNLVLC